MKKIRIGIPRAFIYHRYGVLWKQFFQRMGCKVILSPETNRDILANGIDNTNAEFCLSYKIYVGHVLYLKDRCDYILISRICDYSKKDKVCPMMNGTFDNIKYLIPRNKILAYNIEHTKLAYEFFGFLKMGLRLTKNPLKIICSYLIAKKKQNNYDLTKENEEKNKLITKQKKILIISMFYNIEDKLIANHIINYLKEQNITILYANHLEKKLAASFSEYFSDSLYLKYSKETIGALYYYIHRIDGIIFVSTYPCKIDTIVNNLAILKNRQLPSLNLIIDENTSESNLEAKLENFIERIKGESNE